VTASNFSVFGAEIENMSTKNAINSVMVSA
jgi:hypothetical protein